MKLLKLKKNSKYYLKKAAVSAVGVVTAASLLVSGLFATPAEIATQIPESPPAIVEVYTPEEGPEEEESNAATRKKSVKERIREKLLTWPIWLRSLLLIPLWGIGTLLSLLLRTVLPPVLKWLLGAVFPVLLLLVGLKLLFPDIPLSKLLCKKNRIALIVLSVLLFLTGPVLGHYFPEQKWLPFLEKLALLALTFLIACAQILMKRRATVPNGSK